MKGRKSLYKTTLETTVFLLRGYIPVCDIVIGGDAMLTILSKIDALQERINNTRPLGREEVDELKQYFKVGLTFSSNAIEGNSLTESETKVIIEDGLTIGGRPMKDLLEAVGHSQAFDYMWSLLKNKEITERNIKSLHKLFFHAIDEKNAGKYRKRNVIISGSQYNDTIPSPAELTKAMKDFVTDMSSKRQELHPVIFAALIHKNFVFIHPFVDGNGRVARLLMNLALIQAGYPITIIPPVLRPDYIQLLEKAHIDESEFSKFIAEQVLQTQRDYIRLLRIE